MQLPTKRKDEFWKDLLKQWSSADYDRYNNPLCNNTISLKSFQTNEVVDIMCKDNDCEYKILNMARYKKY